MIADDLLRTGDLSAVRAGLVDTVKRAPSDQGARMFLWQVMALMGDWEKAAVQLRALASLSAEAQMLATVYGQALDAEKTRADAWAGRTPFPVLVASSPWVETLAQAITALGAGRTDEGESLRGEAFDAVGDTPGEIDGANFTWVADLDARLGPAFEAIVAGRFGLVPFEAVTRVKTQGPQDLRDLVWLPVEMMLRSGQSAAALIPARYPGTEAASDALRLGRATEWEGEGPHERPLGQRVWGLDDGSERGLLDLREMRMA